MPIYEYYCSDCDEKFEKLVFKSDATVPCPKCEKADVQRLISACNFGSSDGSVQPASSSNCSSCSAPSCSSCKG